jgi:hypothetical protein
MFAMKIKFTETKGVKQILRYRTTVDNTTVA